MASRKSRNVDLFIAKTKNRMVYGIEKILDLNVKIEPQRKDRRAAQCHSG